MNELQIKSINDLIMTINVNNTKVSEALVLSLNFAKKVKNDELKTFCKNELQGWNPNELNEKNEEEKYYRSIDTYLVFNKPIHTIFFSGGASVESFFSFLETDKNVVKIKMTIPDSISELEETINKSTSSKYIFSTYDSSYFLSDEKGVKVFVYSRIQSYSSVLSSIKNELIKKLLIIQENFDEIIVSQSLPTFNNNIEVLNKVSEGAYGEVWKGKDNRLNRYVAIKILHLSAPSLSSLREHALALARVKHPNVITVYTVEKVFIKDVEVEAIIMEYVEGRTLTDKLNYQLTLEESKLIGNSIIDGLQAIHNVNIAHNDLHSNNVILSKDNSEIKIIDLLYSSDKTFNLLSTASIESKLNRDINEIKYLLFEILKKTIDMFEDSYDFRTKVEHIQNIKKIKEIFNELFNNSNQKNEIINKLDIVKPEITKNITKLLSDLNTESINIAMYLPYCLEIATELDEEELENFCISELNGWDQNDFEVFKKNNENYRRITGYFSLTSELNKMSFFGLDETIRFLENDKNFNKYKFIIIEPVTVIESKLRKFGYGNQNNLATIGMPLKNFVSDTGKLDPEELIQIYFSAEQYFHLYSLIRTELVKRLTILYKKIKSKRWL